MIFYLILLVVAHFSFTYAETISARAFLTCSLVSLQIHCFGGATGTFADSNAVVRAPSSEHFYLDLTTFDVSNLKTAQSNWTQVKPNTFSTLLQAAAFVESTSIANQSQFLIYGGLGDDTSDGGHVPLANPTMIYDVASKQWQSIPTKGNYTAYGAIVDLGQSLWTWGGGYNGTTVAPKNLNVLNYSTRQWSVIAGDSKDDYVSASFTATLLNNRIYMIGGTEGLAGNNSEIYAVDMLRVRWFDTVASTWGYDNATTSNQQNISPRIYHTTTALPNSNKLLLYGGNQPSTTVEIALVNDYAYLYDVVDKQYTLLNLTENGTGPRSGHSAVLYNTSLFIMFGMNSQRQLLQDLQLLDVSNVTQPSWIISKAAADATNPHNASQFSLTTGAVIGIAVGGAIVGVALSVGLLYFLYKKRQQRKQFIIESSDPRRDSFTESMILGKEHTDVFEYPVKQQHEEGEDELTTTLKNESVSDTTAVPASTGSERQDRCEKMEMSSELSKPFESIELPLNNNNNNNNNNKPFENSDSHLNKPFEHTDAHLYKPHGNE